MGVIVLPPLLHVRKLFIDDEMMRRRLPDLLCNESNSSPFLLDS